MSKIWTVADDIDCFSVDSVFVEEIEGKGSPGENPDSPIEIALEACGGSSGGGTKDEEAEEKGSTGAGGRAPSSTGPEPIPIKVEESSRNTSISSHSEIPPSRLSESTVKTHGGGSSRSSSESPANRTKSNQRWMKLRTTVQLSGAISSTVQKKSTLKREDSFLKRFSTRQIDTQETIDINDEDGNETGLGHSEKRRKKKRSLPRTVVNPDGNFYFYWLMLLTFCVLYNMWTLIVRQTFPELQDGIKVIWIATDAFCDLVYVLDIAVQFRTGYLEQGLMVYKTKKLSSHYVGSNPFYFDFACLLPTDLLQMYLGTNPMLRFPRFCKVYRIYNYYYMVESRTVYPNVWRVVNLVHILLLLAHWFGCFYYMLSEVQGFIAPWGYPDPKIHPNFSPLSRKYLGSLYWSTLTLTTIGDLPTPQSNWELGDKKTPFDPTEYTGFRTQGQKSRLLHISSNKGYLFTIVSYLIGVFILATIVGQVGNVITNRNANRLEFERLLDGAKTYMRHHKVPRNMQRRVLRWYDYSWSRGRIQGGGDINTALGLLPDKLKTELALHVNLSVLKKVTIFQECQPEFLHDLVLKMKAYIFTPGDLICRKGEVAREMFIIADGILEVISELGKVLTTMQAGDFFGEIGILNLDGLNKRTADVRSVGYSELFSLSREDVLAAMKDYPEAQDILQTLGRKRLMEARKANAPPVKKGAVVAETKLLAASSKITLTRSESMMSRGKESPETEGAGKRIVEKLRSDVRVLRDAIRRSRRSNSSKEDSSEAGDCGRCGGRMRRENTEQSLNDSHSSSRGILTRMHSVMMSDEKDERGEVSTGPSSSSSLPIMPSKRMHVTNERNVLSSPEPEVIGPGLPLMQRLKLLKMKEDKQQKMQQQPDKNVSEGAAGGGGGEKWDGSGGGGSTGRTEEPKKAAFGKGWSTVTAMSSTSTKGKCSSSGENTGAVAHSKVSIELAPNLLLECGKVLSNESWIPGEGGRKGRGGEVSQKEGSGSGGPGRITPTTTIPSTSASVGDQASASIELRKATCPIRSSSDNESTELGQCTISSRRSGESGSCSDGGGGRYVIHSIPRGRGRRPSALGFREKKCQKMYGSVDDLSPEYARLPFIKKLKILNERQKIAELLMSKTSNSALTRSTSEGSNEIPTRADETDSSGAGGSGGKHSALLGRRTQSSSANYAMHEAGESVGLGGESQIRLQPSSGEQVAAVVRWIQSDISGESGGGKGGAGSGRSGSSVTGTGGLDLINASGEKSWNIFGCPDSGNLCTTTAISPDSNDTPERLNLKSILKRLAEQESNSLNSSQDDGSRSENGDKDNVATDTSVPIDYNLLSAPTIEGYAARHKKLSKNVTFHRVAIQQSPDATDVPLGTPAPLTSLPSFPMPESESSGTQEEVDLGGAAPAEGSPNVLDSLRQMVAKEMSGVQSVFQNKFCSLQEEIRQRDIIISTLEAKINELVERENIREGEESMRRYLVSGADLNGGQFLAGGRGDDGKFSNDYDDDEVFKPSDSGSETRDVDRSDFRVDDDGDEEEVDTRGEGEEGSWDRTHISHEECLEYSGFSGSIPLWELEFHRDANSKAATVDEDSFVLDIGSTSTEYDSTSSSSDEESMRKLVRSNTVIEAPKKSIEAKRSVSKGEDKFADDEGEESSSSASSEDITAYNNKNWEVQMLAEQMERMEEVKEGGGGTSSGADSELEKLERDIEEMNFVMNERSLSHTEIDVLESVLEKKARKIKKLFKAYSVDVGAGYVAAGSAAHRPLSVSSDEKSEQSSKSERSALVRKTSSSASTAAYGRDEALLDASALETAVASGSSGLASRRFSPAAAEISPGERNELAKLSGSWKRGRVKRQISLGQEKRSKLPSFGSSLRALSETDREKLTRRHDSADSISVLPSGKKSIFSRISFVRQWSRSSQSQSLENVAPGGATSENTSSAALSSQQSSSS